MNAVARMCSVKKLFLKIWHNSQENTYVGVSFLRKLQALNFIKKETPTQVLNSNLKPVSTNFLFFTKCEPLKIMKNAFSYILK